MRQTTNIFIGLLLCLTSTLLLANTPSIKRFNSELANRRLTAIQQGITQTGISTASLTRHVDELQQFRLSANDCIEKADMQEKNIASLLKTPVYASNRDAQEQTDYQYLLKKKTLYTKRFAECRLFLLRSQDTLVSLNHEIQVRNRSTLLHHSPSLATQLHTLDTLPLHSISLHRAYQQSGLPALSRSFFLLFILLASGTIAISLLLRRRLILSLRTARNRRPLLNNTFSCLCRYLPSLALFTTSSVLLWGVSLTAVSSLAILSSYMLLYIATLFVIRYNFYPPLPATTALLPVSRHTGKQFFIRSALIANLLLIAACIMQIFQQQTIAPAVIELSRTLFILAIGSSVIWFCFLLHKIPFVKKSASALQRLIKYGFITAITLTIIIDWVGYGALAWFLLWALFSSLGIIALFYIAIRSSHHLIMCFNADASTFANYFRHRLGIYHHKVLIEQQLIKISLYVVIFTAFIVVLMHIWGADINGIDALISGFLTGFSLLDMHITPAKWLAGALVFVIVNLLGRALSHGVESHLQEDKDNPKQIAIASILSYATTAIAVVIALVVAGVNFTGLAIVTGALSVGIGLGLKGIVNNFICGIIILLEKPFKPGDIISVGGDRGTVQKIRIRATQIRTVEREDILIPNEDLITKPVINALFGDRSSRIVCEIGVAYGSDVNLAQELLLKAALQVPEILQAEGSKPRVLFRGFGDSNLNFGLICVVADMKDKGKASSDLNFAINQLFSEHGVEMAFPQMDVHLKRDDVDA